MKWLSGVSDASGVDRIVTVDVHSPFFTRSVTPLVSLSSAGILAEAVRKRISPGFVCVAPDEGAVDNCLAINNALKNTEAIAFFVKKRSRLGVKLLSLKGKVGDEVLLVDDILDTGETLLAACRKLRDRGVKRITIAVTHGLFNGSVWQELFHSGVERIYCTDSSPASRAHASSKIKIIPLGKLIADYFI